MVVLMVVYLALEAINDKFSEHNVPAQIPITKNYITIGNVASNDVRLPLDDPSPKYLTISKGNDNVYCLNGYQIELFVNDRPIHEPTRLKNRDRIRIGDAYVFSFTQLLPLSSPSKQITVKLAPPPKNAEKTTALFQSMRRNKEEKLPKPGPSRLSESETAKISPPSGDATKTPSSSDTVKIVGMRPRGATPTSITQIQPQGISAGKKTPLPSDSMQTEKIVRTAFEKRGPSISQEPQSLGTSTKPKPRDAPKDDSDLPVESEMTLLWQSTPEEEQNVPQLIAPANGQIVSLNRAKFIVGRSAVCDLCLVDDYISRQQLEFSKVPLGFLLKNIGKNDVIVEKKGPQAQHPDSKIILEEKTLKPGDSTLLLQEATIILGKQILYFFNIREDQQAHLETSARDRKYHFYKTLASQKAELLDAAQLQKLLTPPRIILEDLQIGIWFKYLAINDLSGDFFLYHKIKDMLYLCLGDVSGHGAAAALLASQISGIFKILAEQQKSAEEIVQSINQHLLYMKNQKPKQSLYALIDVLQVTQHGIELCIAGNSVPPLYYRSQEKKLISLDTPATPIGLFEGDRFQVYWDALQFAGKDRLLFFTDGVTEAEMNDDSLLEYSRVQKQMQTQLLQETPCEDFLDIFLNWLRGQSEIRDDLSIVLMAKL